MKKLLSIIFCLSFFMSNSFAQILVLNKCWSPIEKNAYGDKIKNFKEFRKYKDIKDHIIKIDNEKNRVIIRNVLDDNNPYGDRIFRTIFKIEEISNNIIIGKSKKKKISNPEHGNKMISVDLNKKKAAIWYSNLDKDKIKFNISCKAYNGSDNSILRSILKKLNGN